MVLKKTHTIDVAAAKAGFSRATGYRLARDPSLLSKESPPRGRRRTDLLAEIFDIEIVPILENSPGIRPVGVLQTPRRPRQRKGKTRPSRPPWPWSKPASRSAPTAISTTSSPGLTLAQ